MMLCGLGLVLPAPALAVGGPVPPVLGGAGITAPGSSFTFIALAAGRATVVERVRRRSTSVEGRAIVRGNFGVPGAAYDGSTTGLSADGRTLVLAGTASSPPAGPTQLVVLDTVRLRTEARIALPGYFTVDAISPTGRWLYLIHYGSGSNPTHYEVRAYDLADRRLLTQPVVDPREAGEKMQGIPLTRTMSADGRWAYTLYQRINGVPFVHALDTVSGSAVCVDVPKLAGADLSAARLLLRAGGVLRIEGDTGPLALVNTRAFGARGHRAVRPTGRSAAAPAGRGRTLPLTLGIAALAALLVLAVLARRLARQLSPDVRAANRAGSS